MKETISKHTYIQAAYQIMTNEGIEALSIRRLGKELDCNPANLYRYFDSLEELMMYASLRYLSHYLGEVDAILNDNKDNYKIHILVWECFARNSFCYPEIFNNLFFGKYTEKLGNVMRDYYTTFPVDLRGIETEQREVFTSGDFYFRDYLMIRKCVDDGWFTAEDAKLLNYISINLYKGHLKSLLDSRIQGNPMEPEAVKAAFMDCLEQVLRKYWLK